MLHCVALLGVCSGNLKGCGVSKWRPRQETKTNPNIDPIDITMACAWPQSPTKACKQTIISLGPVVWIRQGHLLAKTRLTSMKRLVALAAALCAGVGAVISVADAHQFANAQISLQFAASHAPLSYSPPHYPSPWMDPRATGWEEAYAKAKAFVSQMTLVEKVNLTTGTG